MVAANDVRSHCRSLYGFSRANAKTCKKLKRIIPFWESRTTRYHVVHIEPSKLSANFRRVIHWEIAWHSVGSEAQLARGCRNHSSGRSSQSTRRGGASARRGAFGVEFGAEFLRCQDSIRFEDNLRDPINSSEVRFADGGHWFNHSDGWWISDCYSLFSFNYSDCLGWIKRLY